MPFFGKEPLHGNIPLFSFGLNIFKHVAVVVNIGCLIGKIKTDIGIPDEVVFNDGAVNRTSDFQKCVAEEFVFFFFFFFWLLCVASRILVP